MSVSIYHCGKNPNVVCSAATYGCLDPDCEHCENNNVKEVLYLIKSPKWTEHYKKDTYWAPNQSGYVSHIADAGFYGEEEKDSILRRSGNNGAEAIPITKEILRIAYQQIEEVRNNILANKKDAKLRYDCLINEFDRKQMRNDDGVNILDDIAKK